ncbi:hypothetical protein AB5J55_35085 [Streptomyces sp. R11]|uniref:Uncharacterized protein n=1 Tax=Streptomyces sp. R11 TaxID=3238625 RepID=A0AB39N7P0_9ACTN
MVTLSVTRSRVAAVLNRAADGFNTEPWDPYLNPLLNAIDAAAGFTPGKSSRDAEDTSISAWDALAVHLGDQWPGDWEREAGRSQADIVDALRATAAKAVAA